MNTAELKKKIIRKIDSLDETDFEKVYSQLLEVLKLETSYMLSGEENEAIDLALKVSDEDETYSREDLVAEAQNKFPNLRFK